MNSLNIHLNKNPQADNKIYMNFISCYSPLEKFKKNLLFLLTFVNCKIKLDKLIFTLYL